MSSERDGKSAGRRVRALPFAMTWLFFLVVFPLAGYLAVNWYVTKDRETRRWLSYSEGMKARASRPRPMFIVVYDGSVADPFAATPSPGESMRGGSLRR